MIKIFNSNENIVLRRTPSYLLSWISFILGIISVISLFLIWFAPNIVVLLLFGLSFPIFVLIIIFFTIISKNSEHFVDSTTNHQFPENLDSSKTIHDAFIIAHSIGDDKFIIGFDNLIKAFKGKNYPFKIYHCYNPMDLKAVLVNKNTKYVWIFGHGWCGGVAFKWKPVSKGIFHRKSKNVTILRYRDLLENGQAVCPEKSFIAQFHCNHVSKKDPSRITLPEVLMDKNSTPDMYHVSDFLHNNCSVWFSTRRLVKDLERTPYNENDSF